MSSHCFFHKNLLFCFPSFSSFFPGATPPLSPFLGALLLSSLPVLWFFSRNARIQSWSYSPHPHYNSRSGTRPRMGQSSFPDILNLGNRQKDGGLGEVLERHVSCQVTRQGKGRGKHFFVFLYSYQLFHIGLYILHQWNPLLPFSYALLLQHL